MTSDKMKKFLRYEQLKKYAEGTKTYIDEKDTSLDEKISKLILDEKTARELADLELQSYVTEEVASQLQAEIKNREDADSSINESIQNLSDSLNAQIESLTKADAQLEKDFASNIGDVKSELEDKILEETEARRNDILNLESTVTESVKVDGNALIRDEAGNITLNADYIKYLNNALYEANKPAITVFNFKNGIKVSEEIGKSIVVNGFEHKESNTFNIEGTLTLRKNSRDGSVIVEDISKSDVIKDISFTEEVTSNTSYYLVMTTITHETIAKSLSLSFYAPAFIVTSNKDSLSQGQISGESDLDVFNRQRLNSSSFRSTEEATLTSNGYIYFASVGEINKISDPDSGFGVGYISMGQMTLNVNGVNKNYNIYRSSHLTPGTYKFNIS